MDFKHHTSTYFVVQYAFTAIKFLLHLCSVFNEDETGIMQSSIKMYCAWFYLEVGNPGLTLMSLSPCEYSHVQPTVFLLICIPSYQYSLYKNKQAIHLWHWVLWFS